MRKIIVVTFMTLDGIMQAPGGAKEDNSGGFRYGGWTFPFFTKDKIAGKKMAKQMAKPYDLLLGRKTYDIFASYWPQHSEAWPGINEATKYVASSTLRKPKWQNTVILKGKIPQEIRKIKKKKGPDLKVWGSGDFVQTLLTHDLVDELWLKIFPILLGKGKRLFAEGTIPTRFKLLSHAVTSSGVIFANYVRAGRVETGSF